jgi:ABC-type spermidine/putrescine transport system permease subunit II
MIRTGIPGAAMAALLSAPVIAVGLLSFSGSAGMDFYARPTNASLRWWAALLTDFSWSSALATSTGVAVISTAVALAIVTPAVSVWRVSGSRSLAVAMTATCLAFLVPPVVIAVGLYVAIARAGLFDTVLGLSLAHLSVTLPVATFILRHRLAHADISSFSVACTLGASPTRALATWLLAGHRPTLAAAAAAAFMSSLSEATITLFLTDTRVITLPRRVVAGLSQDIDPSGYAAMLAWFLGAILVAWVLGERFRNSQGA